MQEVVHDVLGEMQQLPHERVNPRPHLPRAVGQSGRVHPPLQVVVQILVRVQLRREKAPGPEGNLAGKVWVDDVSLTPATPSTSAVVPGTSASALARGPA